MEWVLLGLLAALCTSLTTIFSKVGLKDINSNFATFFRTIIVILFSVIICLIDGSFSSILDFTYQNYLYLLASGLSTGLSWLCYFKALKLADVNKVAPIDKCSFVPTSLLFLIFFFDETTKNGDWKTIAALVGSMVLMIVGTLLMVINENKGESKSKAWVLFAVLSAIFASLVALFAKLGLRNVNSNLATLFKTMIVCVFSLIIVLVKKDYKGVKEIKGKSWLFLVLSGLTTGGAWLSEYAAYNVVGSNAVAISSMGKLSILVTMVFSALFLKEKFTVKSIIGLILLTGGIVLIIVFSL